VGVVESVRDIGEQTSIERRYYLSSLELDVRKFARTVRSHWGVENQLYRVLDVVFGEDRSRARTGHAAENLATLRHWALNLLKADTRKAKRSIKGRIKAVAWDHNYLSHFLALNPYPDA
jgi:predicted transposase YbfD/YdcC